MDPRFNPYSFNQYPYRPSFLRSFQYTMHSLSLSQTLQTTKTVLYTANQIIPIIVQLKPILHNASSALKVAKAFKSLDEFDDHEIDNSIKKEDL